MTAKINSRRRGRRRRNGQDRRWQGLGLILASISMSDADARPIPSASGLNLDRIRRDYESDKEKKMIKKAIRAGIQRDNIDHRARPDNSQDGFKLKSSSEYEQGSSRDQIGELTSSRDMEEPVNGEDDSQLRKIQDEWYQGHVLTPINADSHSGFGATVSAGEKGKQKAIERISSIPSSSKYNRARGEILRFNSQRSPFHSSQVGPLASRQPATVSVGIFHSNYPFVPSGRRRIRQSDTQARSGDSASHSTSDLRAEKEPYEVVYSISEDVANGNVFKKGWTKWMLDDDLRLAVPDEYRRPRKDSALMIAKNLLGKKWYRWQPGQGYVLSRYKDYGVYKTGPGIALGQLLPPRERVYTSPLPLIPNDSKRDFVWLILVWMVILTMIALVREARSHIRKARRGRRGQLVDGAPLVPSIRIFDVGASPTRTTSMDPASIGLRTRQRTQASKFRDLCKSAFFPETLWVNGKKRSSFSLPDGNSLSMTNLGWSKDTEGKVGLPFTTSSKEGRDPMESAFGGVAVRRSKSSGPSTLSGDASQEELDERRVFDEIKNTAAVASSSSSSNGGHHHRQTNDREDFSAGGVYSTGSNCHLYSNGMTSTSEAIYGANEGGSGPSFAPMKMHATISH